MGPQPTGIGAFQPTTTGFPQPLPHQYPIPSGYPYSSGPFPSQVTNATPNYLAEFDPYAQQPQNQTQTQQIGQWTSGTGPAGVTHPRDLIRIQKSGLEVWDAYSWKQLFSACDALKEAWSARKQQAESIVRQYGGNTDPGLFGPDPAFGYNTQVEGWKQVSGLALTLSDTYVGRPCYDRCSKMRIIISVRRTISWFLQGLRGLSRHCRGIYLPATRSVQQLSTVGRPGK